MGLELMTHDLDVCSTNQASEAAHIARQLI